MGEVIPVQAFELQKFGRLIDFEPSVMIPRIQWDSRKVEPGDWFLCLQGENHDAHDFLKDVFAAGATGAIYQKVKSEREWPGLQVDDTNRFLLDFASWYRELLGVLTIAITGSNGKTSLKELVTFLLQQILGAEQVTATRGNLNNHFGVSYTLLGLEPKNSIAVIEMGMNHRGEISPLSRATAPVFTAISSISTAHIENLGSIEEIAREKVSIIDGQKQGGCLCFLKNIHQKSIIQEYARKKNIPVVEISTDLVSKSKSNSSQVIYEQRDYIFPWPGEHQLQNLNLATGLIRNILTYLNIPLEKIHSAFEKLQLLNSIAGRMHLHPNAQYLIFDDSYNANEGSVKAALQYISDLAQQKNESAYLALGEIAELGEFSGEIHVSLVDYMLEKNISGLLFCGNEELQNAVETAFRKKTNRWLYTCSKNDASVEKGARALAKEMKPGNILLVKGSRSARMERVLDLADFRKLT
ncbi:MAG: UDP-N-acetylmuramoyl-tripeptide--D-alanyl-D-alanine ligase [Leptospiraceae bacterium]|nr:UDP-N-acetylmuramoyl-tripeptide--D-alanyl-D-alanine ligase [Leptospiraceae bacterium]